MASDLGSTYLEEIIRLNRCLPSIFIHDSMRYYHTSARMDTFKYEHFNSNVYLCYYINIWFCILCMCLSIYFVILELEQGIFYFIIQWIFTVELRINSDYFLSYSISLNWLYSLGPLNWFRNTIIFLKLWNENSFAAPPWSPRSPHKIMLAE